jgi:hypothetical protein
VREPKLTKLETDPIWLSADKIANYTLDILEEFPEDEKWEVVSKLKANATNLLFSLSWAIGSATTIGQVYDWGAARKYAVSLRAFLHLSNKRQLFKTDPQIMVELDKLIDDIGTETKKAAKDARLAEADEESTWLKRYEFWRKANDQEDKARKGKA